MDRFFSVDPLQKNFAMLTPYQFASNSPVANIDLDGKEAKYYTIELYNYSGQTGKLLPLTSTTIEEKGKEVAVAGMFHKGHGELGHGTLVSICKQMKRSQKIMMY